MWNETILKPGQSVSYVEWHAWQFEVSKRNQKSVLGTQCFTSRIAFFHIFRFLNGLWATSTTRLAYVVNHVYCYINTWQESMCHRIRYKL